MSNLLNRYKKRIDTRIEDYSKKLMADTRSDFGEDPSLAADAFCEILSRGGKRLRGGLLMFSYEMMGGKKQTVSLEAALAIEIEHAAILIVDDVQDRSDIRREGPSAHRILETVHRKENFLGEPEHFGVSLALNSALIGFHSANLILAELDVDPAIRNQISILFNDSMVVTAHGQTGDIVNESRNQLDIDKVFSVLDWKTSHYSFLNPMSVGSLLAQPKTDTKYLNSFAHHAGVLFQISDDIISTFSDVSGKNPMDDMREGKKTVVTVYAMEHLKGKDRKFLLECMGNRDLTATDFDKARELLVSSGGYDYAKKMALDSSISAQQALSSFEGVWPQQGIDQLAEFIDIIKDRDS